MRKRIRKPILGAAICLMLWVVAPMAALAVETPSDPETSDISATMRLIYADEEMALYEAVPLEGDFPLEQEKTVFSTNFTISIMDEVTPYVNGAVVEGAVSAGRGGGLKIGTAGMDFRPPMVAALICGAGYIVCAGFKKYADGREDN